MSAKAFTLRKNLIIPAGTAFTEAPSKTVYHSDHVQADVALGPDNTIAVVVPVENDDAFNDIFKSGLIVVSEAEYTPAIRPTVGRIIHYTLTAEDAEQINRRRTSPFSVEARIGMREWPQGAQAHIGNTANKGDLVAAIIVAVWGDECVNAKAFLDGTDDLWLLSIMRTPPLAEGYPAAQPQVGNWDWPPRV